MDRKSIKNIIKFLSLIGIFVNIFFLIPLITGIIYEENIKGFIYYELISISLFSIILFLLKNHKIKMHSKDAILSVNIVWIMLGILGAIPLMLLTNINFYDAFFESISGFTTTGATIYNNISDLPKTILILRSTMHWIGGMGIIVLSTGLLSIINPTGTLTLFKSESTGITIEKITPKLKHTALKLWGVYILLTILDLILLKIEGMNLFDAINHAFATISTGGFSTKNESLGYWVNNYYILWTTTIFMILSGINFIAHIKILKGDFSGYKSEEVKWYIYLIIILSLGVSLIHFISSNDSLFFAITNGFFTISSILTTTGFATVDYSTWGQAAISLIIIAMLIGGNAGSTAGGIKVIRYIVMFKNLKAQIKKILSPYVITSIKIDNKKIPENIINNVSAFIFLYLLTVTFISLYLFANNYDALTSISAAIACVGNIGPGFGHVGPVDNFSFFSNTQKIILSIGMIIGRLEFYTFLLLFSRDFWKKF
ncbi:TrkH family potassium uptake protein [Caminibacter mediatlanticus TB-2]|uniref:Trk-type K+ transport system, membrane component n=1 Tax=Caminibacter mediatlanticus TB-2 TaxID=391592 RepID=A0AAI9AFM8_9BACT|nr:TrkH family potassium uptake protein [Caminibacter mediatlanticus]EDM23276.1 Trk-type K+ transport system, membrane component [Caminibacter mediatlanticus TB-2]QCT94200.1 TrkH family potassium uptake protein [Caminibacter mediatlanticus TB-2]